MRDMRDDGTRVLGRAIGYACLLTVGLMLARAQVLHVTSHLPGHGPGVDETPVVIAVVDLAAGMRIPARALRTAVVPRSQLPAGTFASLEALEGRVLRRPVAAGQPIVESALQPRMPVHVVAV